MAATPGRTPQSRTVAGVGTTLGAATLTAPADSFHEEDVGRTITGTGIPAGATIASVQSPTAATMSANATATGTVTVTLGATTGEAYGFRGWSPETDTESETYPITGGAGATAPSRLTNPTTQQSQRYRQ